MSEGELKLELLLDLGEMIAREVELDELLATFGARVARAMRAERATLWLVDAATGEIRSRIADLPEVDELRMPIGRGVAGYVAREAKTVNVRDASTDERWAPEIDQRTGYTTVSMLCVPIVGAGDRLRGVAQVLNKQGGVFTAQDEVFLAALCKQIDRALEYTTLRADRDAPRGLPVRGPFNHIVGASPAMQAVYGQVTRAAVTGATVLLHGETGTGKGLFARAIHVNSPRRDGPLVHVDCTTLPASLVESELFGHERGAYTSADARVIGKVERAAGGTLFLDEIGELPVEVQGKLLRFLQDRQFERVGGSQLLEADARIVCATNRDLEAMVAAGGFRSDLYYRVRVIDIAVPPLRDRGDDVLTLAEHFIAIYARRYGGDPPRLTPAARRRLLEHRWPGNVRELEHAIERAVVLADGPTIGPDALGLLDPTVAASPATDAGAAGVTLPHGLTLDQVAARYAAASLERLDGNRSATARQLAIGRNRLARMLRDDGDGDDGAG